MSDIPPEIRRNNTATIIFNMMPIGQKGLKERLNVSRDAIARAFRVLREHNLIYITGYESSGNYIYPMYDSGDYVDAERPTKKQLRNAVVLKYRNKTRDKEKQKCAAYREKNRALLSEKQKARYKLKKDEILAKAREKTKAKKAPKFLTQWRTALPWKARA